MSASPRRVLAAANALRAGMTLREACRLSGLSYGTVNRIRSEIKRAGQLPEKIKLPDDKPTTKSLLVVGRRLSVAIQRALALTPPIAETHRDFTPPSALRLSSKEADVLDALLRCAGRVATRQHLFACAWPHDEIESDKNLDVQILKLRRKLKPHGATIETRWGVGYFLSRADRDKIMAIGDEPIHIPPFLDLKGRPCVKKPCSPPPSASSDSSPSTTPMAAAS